MTIILSNSTRVSFSNKTNNVLFIQIATTETKHCSQIFSNLMLTLARKIIILRLSTNISKTSISLKLPTYLCPFQISSLSPKTTMETTFTKQTIIHKIRTPKISSIFYKYHNSILIMSTQPDLSNKVISRLYSIRNNKAFQTNTQLYNPIMCIISI